MSLPTTRHAYLDCYTYFDSTLDDPKGIRLRVADIDAATNLRMRLHQARKIRRNESMDIYEPGHPQYGVSPYDNIVVRIRTVSGQVYLYLEQIPISTEIEALSELEEADASDSRGTNNSGDSPEHLATGAGTGDRDGVEVRQEDGVDATPVRSPQGIRRI